MQTIFSIHGKVEGLEQGFKSTNERIGRLDDSISARLLAVESELKSVASDIRTGKILAGITGTILTIVGGFVATALFKLLDLALAYYKANPAVH